MVARKAYHQLDPVRLSRQEFESLPFRANAPEKPKVGDRFRDAAYPEEVFVWQEYDAPVRGEWGKPDKEVKDPRGLRHMPKDQSGLKDGDVYANERGTARQWRAYPKGSEITGEWQMAAADVRG